MNIREIFADELERFGEKSIAARVRDGSDNSHGGLAAISAMQRLIAELSTPLGDGDFRDERRESVYVVIDGERAYQESQKGNAKRHAGVTGPVQVGAFIVYMEKCLNDAREAVYRGETGAIEALPFIRKVAALGVACMETHGAPKR